MKLPNKILPRAVVVYFKEKKWRLFGPQNFAWFFFLQLMWRFKRRKQIRRGYPAPFKQMFIGLPENVTKIDAVYERPIDNCIIFFTGNLRFTLLVRFILLPIFLKVFFQEKYTGYLMDNVFTRTPDQFTIWVYLYLWML